jgi:hypothetical protein
MNRLVAGSILISALGACGSSAPAPASGTLSLPDVPDAIKAPVDEHVAGRFHIEAVETYACRAAATDGGMAYAWISIMFDAKIEDWDTHAVIGTHTHAPAPTFTSNDGSSVVGKPVAQVPSPTGTGGPWLLLSAVSHSGTGMFSNVTSLQRINTAGASSPQATCDATTNPTAQQTVNGSSDFYYYTK